MRDGVRLSAVVSGEHLGELAGDPSGQRVDLQQRVQLAAALVAATGAERRLRQGRVDRVLAAVAHAHLPQRGSALRRGLEGAHLKTIIC